MGQLDIGIEQVKGLGPQRVLLLQGELGIFTLRQLIHYYPFRYEDRTKTRNVESITAEDDGRYVQLAGTVTAVEMLGQGRSERLVAYLSDGRATVELIWFKGIRWLKGRIGGLKQVLVFGRVSEFNGRFSLVHPEVEAYDPAAPVSKGLVPVYETTEKMKLKRLDSKALGPIIAGAVGFAKPLIDEVLPTDLVLAEQLLPRPEAIEQIHKPVSEEMLEGARYRLKFEELFRLQIQLGFARAEHDTTQQGFVLGRSVLTKQFIEEVLPFELTGAQKRVLREIYDDTHSGKHMNRLLQGDVGSGKTAVAFVAMLMAIDAGHQACLIAPTEILAEQHFAGLSAWAAALGLRLEKLTGSSTTKERKVLHEGLRTGEVHVLVGTHAVLEDVVAFHSLALCVIDEQHRFGVAQRARLRAKGAGGNMPHVLIMSATPIPRTLALTAYGELDVSKIDELPVGRKAIVTVHRYEKDRVKLNEFIRQEIHKGRQCYIVYPLIEENEKLDALALEEGVEHVRAAFPEFKIGIVHGRMKWPEREVEMLAFLKNEVQILVATTVIEVGINVPNATIMVIENAERFGLSQLHQLRGRVGRGADQSYCVLITKTGLSQDSRVRIKTMVSSTDGFEIAEIDLKLRGAGDMLGTQQSGDLSFRLADLALDEPILTKARGYAQTLVSNLEYTNLKPTQLPWYKALQEDRPDRKDFLKVG